MFWCQLFLAVLLASVTQTRCLCKTPSSHLYRLGPADVDLGVMHVVRGDPEHLFLLQRAVGNDYVRVYVSSDGEVWHRARRQEQLSMSRLVVSSGITHSKVLYRLSDGASQLERSTDNGRTWVPAKLDFHKANGEHKQRTRTNI